MAAPTDVRVEATSIDTTVIRWTYSGSAAIAVYRSTDGSIYSEVTDVTNRVLAGTTSYTDVALATGTKYWYKLSDDAGSTFSSVVTVYTHFCAEIHHGSEEMRLPRLTADGDPIEEFNELATRVEQVLGDRVLTEDQCATCPVDGAIILNCSNGCKNWVVIVDEDINSVTMDFCEQGPGSIEFIIPPNTTRGICGFPGGFGFTGDECTQAPISGGTEGRSVSVGTANGNRAVAKSSGSRPGYNSGAGRSSGGSGGGTCTCVPSGNGALTIKSCNSNNSLACSGAKSLKLIACGGKGPYSWSKTGDVTLQGGTGQAVGTTATGAQVTVRPPTNSGGAVAGTAYSKNIFGIGQGHSAGTTHVGGGTSANYNCDDSFDACVVRTGSPITCAYVDASPDCPTHNGHPVSGSASCLTVTCTVICTSECPCAQSKGAVEDRRSAGMISGGCNPCGLQEGSTVSVTDSVGTVTTIILSA